MKHRIHRAGHVDVLRNILAYEAELRMHLQVRNVAIGPGDEIVEAEHVPAFFQEVITKMRAKKSSTASNYGTQRTNPFPG